MLYDALIDSLITENEVSRKLHLEELNDSRVASVHLMINLHVNVHVCISFTPS